MSYTKRQIIDMAFETMGIATSLYDLEPEQIETARKRLDSMMATWNIKGLRMGYPIHANPDDGDLDESSNLPDGAIEAVIANLAIRLAPSYGKQLTPEAKTTARESMSALYGFISRPIPMQLPGGYALGAGYKTYNGVAPFTADPADPLLAGNDGPIEY